MKTDQDSAQPFSALHGQPATAHHAEAIARDFAVGDVLSGPFLPANPTRLRGSARAAVYHGVLPLNRKVAHDDLHVGPGIWSRTATTGAHASGVGMRIVVALGGNALLQRGDRPDAGVQMGHVREAARALASLALGLITQTVAEPPELNPGAKP